MTIDWIATNMPAYLSEGSRRFARDKPDNPAAKLDYYLTSSSMSSLASASLNSSRRAKPSGRQAENSQAFSWSSASSYMAPRRHSRLLDHKKDPLTWTGESRDLRHRRVGQVRPYANGSPTNANTSSPLDSSGFSENCTIAEKTSVEHFARPPYQINLQKSHKQSSLAGRVHYIQAKPKSLSTDSVSVNNKLGFARASLFVDRLSSSQNRASLPRLKGRNVNRQNRRFLIRGGQASDAYALSELFSQSEIPGFREIFASDSYLRKFCWIVAFLVMTVLSLNDTIELIAEYYNYPITVDVRHRDSARLPFPAVTVCNLNAVRFSALCSSSSSRLDLAGQIPSELRERLCGIQVEKKNTTDSDINDINNIGITTSAATIEPPSSPIAEVQPITSPTDQASTASGGLEPPPSGSSRVPNNSSGSGEFAETAATSFSSPHKVSHTSLATSTLASVAPTGANQASTRRTTAAGGLDLGDFALHPMPVMDRSRLGQLKAARRRHTGKRSISLASSQRPFASGSSRVKVGASSSWGAPGERQASASIQQSKRMLASQFNKPNVNVQTNRAPSSPGGPHNSRNVAAPANNPPTPFNFQNPSGHSGSAHQTTTPALNATTFAPPTLPEEFELTERQERELHENLTNWLAVMYNRDPDLTRSLGHQFDDMILRCTMKSINCTHQRSFETSFSPTEGNCFTYRSRVKRRSSATSRSSQVFEDANLAGTSQGLELVLNLEKNEYISGSSQVGALVMIHHPSDLSYAASEATFVAPEFTTYIGIKMVNITRLPYPYPEQCIDSWPAKIADTSTRNSTYSQQACLKICLQRTIQSHCQCQSAFLPVVEIDGQSAAPTTAPQGTGANVRQASDASAGNQSSAQSLSPVNLDNQQQQQQQQSKSQQPRIIICDTRKMTTRQCVREVMFRAADRVHKCDCPPKCRIVRYDKTISMARWPTREDKVTFDRGKLDVNFQNLAKVIVYFQTMTCEEITQQAVFNAAKLFSSLGGVMGMYVGFSFLSVFEIFEVMSRKIWHHLTVKFLAGNNSYVVVRGPERRS